MKNPYFFGYGSLVNVSTHTYVDPRPARLTGWKRAWVQAEERGQAFLTAVPAPEFEIEGLVAAVPDADWVALDQREYAYERLGAAEKVSHDLPDGTDIQVYAVSPKVQNTITPAYPVWMSYLDVVVQGYLHVFGEAGVAGFFETTDNWARPFVDDRADPKYPRAQVLSASEQALVDHWLAQTAAERVRA